MLSLGQFLGGLIRILHTVLIMSIWLSPFYITNPRWLLIAIAAQAAIMAQLAVTGNRCTLTMWEEWLSGERFVYHEGKSMTGFNVILTKWFGVDGMLRINRLVPQIVILANCYKIWIAI